MVGMSPNRPGFTAGTEEEVWSAHPAIRSTLYFWVFSVIAALCVFYLWQRITLGLYSVGFFSATPPLQAAMFPGGVLSWWMQAIPVVSCLFPVFWYSLGLMCTSYRLTTQRLHVRTGILVRTYDQLELFRVRDFLVDSPLYMVVLGLGHVRVISRDESLPLLTLIAMDQPEKLVDLIREHTQRRKDEVGMREIETNTQ